MLTFLDATQSLLHQSYQQRITAAAALRNRRQELEDRARKIPSNKSERELLEKEIELLSRVIGSLALPPLQVISDSRRRELNQLMQVERAVKALEVEMEWQR